MPHPARDAVAPELRARGSRVRSCVFLCAPRERAETAGTGVEDRGIMAGARGDVTKTISGEELAAAIERHVLCAKLAIEAKKLQRPTNQWRSGPS